MKLPVPILLLFFSICTLPVKGADKLIVKNGGMTQGYDSPANWQKEGPGELARDTTTFKVGPASLRVTAGGDSTNAFQQISGGAGLTFKVAGWMKTSGDVKAQVFIHAFSDGFKNNQFMQVRYAAGDGDWAEIDKEIVLPEWTAFFRIGLMVEGKGNAWLDEVREASQPVDKGEPMTEQDRAISGPPPTGKPWEPGWGYYGQFPTAWQGHFQSQIDRSKNGGVDVVFLGDSITQGWGDTGKESWTRDFEPLNAVNYGIGGDSTRQVLWRIRQGLFVGIAPKLVVIKIGTNNLYGDGNAGTDEEIARGIEAVVKSVREKLPMSRVLLLGILPRQNDYFSGRIAAINALAARLDDGKAIHYLDLGPRFQTTPGKGDLLADRYSEDRLHLAAKGYEVIAEAINPVVGELVKLPPLAASRPADGKRDPWLWPFAVDSIWNTPIGDGARYTDEGFLPAPPEIISDPEYFYKVADSDPERPLLEPGGWENRTGQTRELRKLRLPDDIVLDNSRPGFTPNNATALLMPDGKTLEQLEPFARPKAGGPAYGIPKPFFGGTDIFGPGIVGTHWGSGMSAFGGSLRHGELTGTEPIRHALKLEIWGKKYLHFDKADPTPGFRWPADMADGYAGNGAENGGYGGNNPPLEMGALLAIAPKHTEASLKLKTAPGRKMFHALQNYGGYLVDDTASDATAICIESHAIDEFREVFGYDFDARSGATGAAADWLADQRALCTALSVVDNSAQETVGGGGKRRAPAAPDLGEYDHMPPSVPEGLAAGKIASRSVALTWTPSRDDVRVMAYEVFANGKLVGRSAGRPSLEIAGLSPATTHSIAIRTRDSSMNVSPLSKPLAVTTPPLPAGTFEDDFRGDLTVWKLENAKAESGRLLLQNWQGEASAMLTAPAWAAPFTLRCRLDITGSASSNVSIVGFNHRDEQNTSWLEIRGKGPDAAVSLHHTTNGESKTLAERKGWNSSDVEITRDATGAITVRASDGGQTEVLFSKVPAPEPASGTIGFRTRHQELSVGDFHVAKP